METRITVHKYSLALKSLFEENENPAQAGPMKKYMRDQFEYLGIKTPQSAALMKGFIAEHFDTSRQAVSKHIKILTECRLVDQEINGREIYYHFNPGKEKENRRLRKERERK